LYSIVGRLVGSSDQGEEDDMEGCPPIVVIDNLDNAQASPTWMTIQQPNLIGKFRGKSRKFARLHKHIDLNPPHQITLAGVAQSVERVALMTARDKPQGRGFEPLLRLFLYQAHTSSCSFALVMDMFFTFLIERCNQRTSKQATRFAVNRNKRIIVFES
jgi:hypothetical protein